VEDGVTGHARHHLDRGADVDQDLMCGEDALERDLVRAVDSVAPERAEIAHR